MLDRVGIVSGVNHHLVRHRLVELLLLFLCFYLPGFLGGGQDSADLPRYMIQYISIAVPQTLLILYILWIQKEPGLQFFGLVGIKLVVLLQGVLLVVGLLAVFFLVGAFTTLLPAAARELFNSGFRWTLPVALRPGWLLISMFFCLVTGYREELFYRAYLLTRFSELGLAAPLAVAASSILFAFGHMYQGIGGVAYALVQGVVFSFVFLRKKNLHTLAAAHAIYNFCILIIGSHSRALIVLTN